jgi:UDPglucose 6-dehydrogenase
MRIAVIGSGYVGLVSGACFSETGNHVVCVDNDAEKIKTLEAGDIPIFEPGLEGMLETNRKAGRIEFTTDLDTAVKKSRIVFIAVGTPSDESRPSPRPSARRWTAPRSSWTSPPSPSAPRRA